jgi:hypothetical protein
MVTHVDGVRFECAMCRFEVSAAVVAKVESEEWYVPIEPIRSIRDRKKERSADQRRSGYGAGAEASGT